MSSITVTSDGSSRSVKDTQFAGVSADELPEPTVDFSCKKETAETIPSVIVDVKQGDSWVRIPVTETTLWENKDGPASISKTAKVKFPMEWGGVSILQFVDGFQTQNTLAEQDEKYDQCRIFFYDDNTENDNVNSRYVLKHFGYVGSLGPAKNGTGKFWVYDPSKLMAGISVGESFTQPTIDDIVSFVVGEIKSKSIFTDVKTTAGSNINTSQKVDQRGTVGPSQILTTALLEGVLGANSSTALPAQKTFKSNRSNLVDLMNWFSNLTDSRWWFEPREEGITFVVDGSFEGSTGFERKYFTDNESPQQVLDAIPSDETSFTDIDVLNNNAIVDMKPYNTLIVRGESKPSERNNNPYRGAASTSPHTQEYPFVKVRYEPLYKRAGEYEYLPSDIEGTKTTLDATEDEAVNEMRKHLEDSTEGSLELRGEPHMEPYDYVTTIPVCQDTYPNTEAAPITWEINAVKHIHGGNRQYTCELGLSIAVQDDKITTVDKKYKETT
jgi:hypothetical protein